jgi:hypothetical protein
MIDLGMVTADVKNKGWQNCFLLETWKTDAGEPEKKRRRPYLRDDGSLWTFRPNSRKYITRYELYPAILDLEVIPKTSEDPEDKRAAWVKSWQKVKKTLEASGLYPDVLQDINNALDIGYDKIQQARTIENRWDQSISYQENQEKNRADIAAIDSRINTGWTLWHMSEPAKVKKMYFGKYGTAEKLDVIAEYLRQKKECHVTGRSGYDVSFRYDPKQNKAWYSEEYRGCGNGHYYLALNGTHALYYEDD